MRFHCVPVDFCVVKNFIYSTETTSLLFSHADGRNHVVLRSCPLYIWQHVTQWLKSVARTDEETSSWSWRWTFRRRATDKLIAWATARVRVHLPATTHRAPPPAPCTRSKSHAQTVHGAMMTHKLKPHLARTGTVFTICGCSDAS